MPDPAGAHEKLQVQQKAAQVGFDWDDIEDVFRKVEEEIRELRDVYKSNNVERITDELGDAFLLSLTSQVPQCTT